MKIYIKFKDINIKNRTYYFLDDINMKTFDTYKLKIDESHTKVLLFITL